MINLRNLYIIWKKDKKGCRKKKKYTTIKWTEEKYFSQEMSYYIIKKFTVSQKELKVNKILESCFTLFSKSTVNLSHYYT